MTIPISDTKRQYLEIKPEIDAAIKRVLDSNWFILGQEVEAFEREFADFIGTKHAIGVGSGTEAIHLALWAAGIKSGDEVITVANTAVPTICAIRAAGAIPVFVDIDPESFNMDPKLLGSAINKKTRAIVPAHLFGQTADMDPILKIAKDANLIVIEDACQAHGAEYRSKKVGTLGLAGAFSFYPSKNLGAFGDGGIVVTNNSELAEKVKMLRNYGQSKRYYHDIEGYNSRLDELQAAILRVKLKHLNAWNKKRRKLALLYHKLLTDSSVIRPFEKEYGKHVFHLYVIRSKKREELQKHLKEKGIMTNIHYPIPIHLQKAYKSLKVKKGSLPITEKYAGEILSLPLFPELTEEEVKNVARAIKEFK